MITQTAMIVDDRQQPDIYCPACGAPVLLENGAVLKPCAHLAFVYSPSVFEYDAVSPQIQAILDRCVKEAELGEEEGLDEDEGEEELDEGLDLDEELVAKPYPGCAQFLKKCPRSLLILQMVCEGMACGPASNSIIVAFDFAD